MLLYYSPLICYRIRIYMLKQYNGLYNIDYKIQVIQCNECHLERCLGGKCSTDARKSSAKTTVCSLNECQSAFDH